MEFESPTNLSFGPEVVHVYAHVYAQVYAQAYAQVYAQV